MADIKFSQFTNIPTPNANSFFVGYNSVTNNNTRTSLSDLITAIGGNYLPLAGGTLTGALNGTSAVFGSSITSGATGASDGSFTIKRASDGLSVANFSIDTANGFAKLFTEYSYLTFSTEGTERARFVQSNFLLGTTTNAGYKLDVNGTARVGADATINEVTVGRGGGNVADNTAIGYQSLFTNNEADSRYNTAIGYQTLFSLNSYQAINNTAVGFQSGFGLTEGFDNTAIGSNALNHSDKWDGNTAIGSASLYNLNEGDFNTALGFNSGYDFSSGNNNIFIGKGQNSVTSMSGTTMIGVDDYADGDNQMRFGSASVPNGQVDSENEWGYNAKWRVYINGSPYWIPLQFA